MKTDDLELNLSAVDGGAWIGYIPDLEGVEFLVRGSEYEPYQKALRRSMTVQSRKQRVQSAINIDTDKYDLISRQLAAEHLLLDWRGIESSDGSPLAYDPELAKRLMTDRKYKPFQNGVLFAINMVDYNILDHREETVGN